MKILRVRFFNINSLRGRHELDFTQTPLRDAGLFAITGPTGAGKTTILDAITLALYGQVPRHDSSVEQVMSQGTGESWAEVEFAVNNQHYRSKWSQHRARKNADGPLQDSKMELSQRPAEADETVDKWPFLETYKSKVPGRVAELSGLEYKQFLRSVLLAQGDFTKFLKSSPGERAQLLEKITDTRTYSDISRFAFEKAKQEDQRTAELRTGLAGVNLLSDEEVATLEASARDLTAQVQATTAEQQRLTQAHTWRRRLAELSEAQRQGQTRLHALSSEAETLVPVRQRMARHEQALPFRTPWALLREADKQHLQLGQEAEALRQQLPQLQAALAKAVASQQQAEASHAAAVASRREQEPRLNQAAEKDIELTAARKQLDENRREYDRRNEQCKLLKTSTEAATSQQQALQQQFRQLQDWLLKNQHTADYGEALGALTGNLQDWEHLRGELGELQTSEANRQKRLEAAQAAAQQGQAAVEQATQQVAALEEQKHAATATRDHWTGQLHRHQTSLRQQQAEQQGHWQDLRRLVQAQQLILSHEEARQHLTAGEPCPLCGATEHPFATGELAVSAASVRQDQRREQELGQRLQQLNTRLTQVAGLLGMVESHATAGEETSAAGALLSEAEEAAAAAGLRAAVQQLRALDQQQPALQVQLSRAQGTVKNAAEQQQELTEELTRLRQRLADAREREPLVRGLIASICSSFGLQFGGENGPALVDQLKTLGAAYQTQLKAARDAERELALLAQKLAKEVPEKDELLAWLKTNKGELLQQHEAIQQLQQTRQELFAGADIARARQQLQAAEDTAAQQLRLAEQQAQTHRTALALTEEKQKQRETDAARQAQTRDAQYADLVAGLRTAGLPPAPTALAERLLPDTVAQQLSQQLTRHEQAVAAAQQTLLDVAQQLHTEEGRALTTEPLEALATQLSASTAHLAHLNQQLGQCQQQLRAHTQGLERHAALAQQIEKQQHEARRWRILADLIGSADGKKFSEFAQGLTLARLVELANRHLRRLNERYRIARHPSEHLDLLVVDEYQAGATRSMNSLSGGESFLVSLALALGLSELAGRKTQIDTLFIDEGFGTLDPDTLEVALAALEQLQGLGKTIGIISHVEALKERVNTQIQVRRGAGGVSTLHVVG
ncbi:AAA family ATPase [Hymenobacter daeguensis]